MKNTSIYINVFMCQLVLSEQKEAIATGYKSSEELESAKKTSNTWGED
jgi:hypothetical protein